MNTFLVIDTIRLNTPNRFALTGVVREGVVVAGMQVFHPALVPDTGLEIMKVDLIQQGMTLAEHYMAVLLRLDEVIDKGLDKREMWLGKEIQCG